MWSGIKGRLSLAAPNSHKVLGKALNSYDLGVRVHLIGHIDAVPAALQGELTGIISGSPSEGVYSVDFYAPAVGEEDAMNPALVLYTADGLKASQLRLCVDDSNSALSAVGRPGSSMCSVPMTELHLHGFGPNAKGRSARLGGLGSRPELNGLTCTILWGPDDKGQYTVELSLEEGDHSVLIVQPDCLTLRIRRGSLQELTAEVHTLPQARPMKAGNSLGEVVAPANHGGSQDEMQQEKPATSSPTVKPPRKAKSEPDVEISTPSPPRISPAALAALAAASTASKSPPRKDDERDRKFEELDAELSRCCSVDFAEVESPAALLLATPALGKTWPTLERSSSKYKTDPLGSRRKHKKSKDSSKRRSGEGKPRKRDQSGERRSQQET